MLALKTIPELSITVTGNYINYTQTEVVTNLAPNSRKYHPYKKNTRSYSGIHLPELLKLALRENLMLTPISIPPNATIQQKLQLCFNEENYNYTPIYRYFYVGKTLYKQKRELTAKQLHNEFKTTAGPTNSCYKLRAALRLYDLFHTCKNVLQNPIFQPLKIQYIGKLTELKFQQFSDQISLIILDYYLEITDSTWTSTELNLEKKQTGINNIEKKRPKTSKCFNRTLCESLAKVLTDFERAYTLFSTLEEKKRTAATHIEYSQAQQKERHDNKLPPITNEFKVGNKVLLYRTKAEKQWSGKFENKWNGPFYIHEILGNGSYKLRLDDKILAKVAHGDRLKHYHFRNNSEPLIPQIGIHSLLVKPEDIPQNLEPIIIIEQQPNLNT
ncbi:hypothetical protein G9A89_002083 [Geosiphon pyriformis]|nr:hypothetical protein G9A89_002083 [Geosiphon pyriformis]